MASTSRARQATFPFARTRRRRRPRGSRGPGRPPKGPVAGVSHLARPVLPNGVPLHVTLRLRNALPSLRGPAEKAALFAAFRAGRERFGFRLVHFSIQANHVHMVAEAGDRRALARGVQGLAIRAARALNRLWRRSGKVFADRYHAAQLRSPRAVRNALAYVLLNHRRHGSAMPGPDPYSSGAWFDGWRGGGPKWPRGVSPGPAPAAQARSWLLSAGWKRWPLVGMREVPGPAREPGH